MFTMLAALAAAGAQPELPAWMAGCWEQRQGERWTEECWTTPRAGVMLGSGRSGTGDRLQSWEVMQIMQDPNVGMAFWGAPSGRDRTSFGWTADGGEGVTFINATHDYPQRIRYWREGDMLNAETSLVDGGRPMRWTYRRR